tara:strand:+ start:354 stop:1289 length:936 start_codon:yes stop_codon:yes gene_type:complete
MITKTNKDKNQLHIFAVTNQINAIVVYEYIKENNINFNDIRIFFVRDVSALNIFKGIKFLGCKRGFLEKIGDHLIRATSYKAVVRRTIESNKKPFIYYTAWLDEMSREIVASKYCKGHVYMEEGDQTYCDFPLFPSTPGYRIVPRHIARVNGDTNYWRDDGLLWVGITEKSFKTAPVEKKYTLKSFDHFKKVYQPILKEYKTILLMPSPCRLPKSEWKKSLIKLTLGVEGQFALKLHPGYGANTDTHKKFESYLVDLGFSQSIVCSNEVIIEGEMLFHQKKLIGDRSSLERYADFFGSVFVKIDFLYGEFY